MTQTRARGLFFILTLAISVVAFGANSNPINDKAEATVGAMNVSASAIQWSASGSYERAVLTVSGPENYSFSKEFEAGRMPTLRLVDLGKNVFDGSYTWQVRIVPRISPDTRRKLAEAREAGDEQAASRIQAEAGLNQNFSHSGSFMIQSGAFVGNDAIEQPGPGGRKVTTNALKPAPEDQVYPDDVIIQGSACVGLDCVNNESFGFDTIRLKENNTRINFTDTSVGSFPSNDWELTANDSASGAASKFSITDITGSKVPFTVTAGAATNSIFVDSTGRVGFRTSTPVLDLHVNTSNTPAMRLEQNNSGGFTAQTWDVAGNEANFFVRDVTGGSRLPFRIRPGAPTSSLDIAADGQVGIATASPDAPLEVNVVSTNPGAGNSAILVESTNSQDAIIGLGAGPNFSINSDGFLFGYNGSAGVGRGFIGTRPTAGTGEIVFAVKNITEMKLTATGLEVTDAIRVGGVTLNVPDYVFEKDYKLMPLNELASYISTNKHLPDVPSESEIKAKGLDLGGFHMNLLRKVEELTLYTVTQDETIKRLEARLAELEGQVKKQ